MTSLDDDGREPKLYPGFGPGLVARSQVMVQA